MKVAIIYYKFYNNVDKDIYVGGAEHYIYQLSKVCLELGWEPIVFQIAKEPFELTFQQIKVVGVKPPIKFRSVINKALYKAAINSIDAKKDLVIFAADLCSIKTDNLRCISINHGLFWDCPTALGGPYQYALQGWVGRLYKTFIKIRMRNLFDNATTRVCVDYNFLNWYRTMINDFPEKRVLVIPNFSHIATLSELQEEESQQPIKVLFARRFIEYRGTRIMAEAVQRILQRTGNVIFTFAGEGPEELFLRNLFKGEPRVKFIKFDPQESLMVNLQHQISVIPSLASEGTSLSVAEAMGAGRAVIATNVGGMTNMIIDNYNGLLVHPTADDVEDALLRLIGDPGLRRRLSQAAYETARWAFSYERWRASWIRLLQSYVDN